MIVLFLPFVFCLPGDHLCLFAACLDHLPFLVDDSCFALDISFCLDLTLPVFTLYILNCTWIHNCLALGYISHSVLLNAMLVPHYLREAGLLE